MHRFYNSAAVLMGTVKSTEYDIIHLSDNRATAAFFDITPEAMQTQSAQMKGESISCIRMWLEACQESTTTPDAVRFDYRHKGKDWLNLTVNYIGLSESRRKRFLHVANDISDRKEAEHALQEANERLEVCAEQRTDELAKANRQLR